MNSTEIIYQKGEIKPMSNLTYRLEEWLLFLWDIFLRHPRQDLHNVPLEKGMIVVDYGCGPGHYTIPLAEMVGPQGQVYAVEIQPLALETVKRKAAQKCLKNIFPVLVDSYNTGIPGASADAVLLIDAFHMISNRDALFKEICRILKLEGFLYMDPGHMNALEVKRIVENSGFFTLDEFDGKNMKIKKKVEIC